jgi:phosphatidylinositol 4-kinase
MRECDWERIRTVCGSHGYAERPNWFRSANATVLSQDRHNGNILVDDAGHIVHIDFGFILETSPGGNLGFETAAFKLSHEMTQLLDPGGTRTSPHFLYFQELVVRGFLAARRCDPLQ